ncbi:MAG: tetratricopeptide repeat protein [Alphaproteobacteria bacterium]
MDWHNISLNQGYAAPKYDSGPRYDELNVSPGDLIDVKLLQEKAQQGDAQAQYNLGVFYDWGHESDPSKAMEWFKKAREKGHILAQFNLGCIYANRQSSRKEMDQKNRVRAMKWFKKDAIQEYQEAQYNLGMAYVIGHGVVKDHSKAKIWLQKAADQGHIISKYNLGVMYANRLGGKKDQVRSLKLFWEVALEGLEGFAKAP